MRRRRRRRRRTQSCQRPQPQHRRRGRIIPVIAVPGVFLSWIVPLALLWPSCFLGGVPAAASAVAASVRSGIMVHSPLCPLSDGVPSVSSALHDKEDEEEDTEIDSNDDNDDDDDDDNDEDEEDEEEEICIIFSDLDGTLIHYPASPTGTARSTQDDETADDDDDEKEEGAARRRKILTLPTSSTGLAGRISAQTLCQLRDLRRTRIRTTSRAKNTNTNKKKKKRIQVVLISGMRTTTFFQRLPYLPKADAYCTENGGRIFYPCTNTTTTTTAGLLRWVQPQHFQGCEEEDVTPFGIREDTVWKERMRHALHGEKHTPPPTSSTSATTTRTKPNPGDIEDVRRPEAEEETFHKEGVFWDFARDLVQNKHFVLDTTGYSTCFRVNRKQQRPPAASSTSSYQFEDLVNGTVFENTDLLRTHNIASSMNLNCADFYPAMSGKKNCCLYLAAKFFPERCGRTVDTNNTNDELLAASTTKTTQKHEGTNEGAAASTSAMEFLSHHALCLCDDDNDVEMALACHHAYLPDIASHSMRETIRHYPRHFTSIPVWKEEEDNNHTTAHDWSNTATPTCSSSRKSSSSSSSSSGSRGSRDPIIQRGTTDATELLLSMIMERLGTNTNNEA